MKDVFELCLLITAAVVVIPFFKVIYQTLIEKIEMSRKREMTMIGSLFATIIVCLASKKLGYTSPLWLVFPIQAAVGLLMYYYQKVQDFLEKNIYGGGGKYWTVSFSVIYFFLLLALEILLDGRGAGGFILPLFVFALAVAFRAAYLVRKQ